MGRGTCALHTTGPCVELIPDMDANRKVDVMFFLAGNGLAEGHFSKINVGQRCVSRNVERFCSPKR